MKQKYFAHETAVIDENCQIGEGTKIWHFSHIMTGCVIGTNCNIGQNVVISPEVVLGNNVKVQNNVSVYTGVICEDDVFLGPSCVFTNVTNPRSAVNRKSQYAGTHVERGDNRCKCYRCLRTRYRRLCFYRCRSCRDETCTRLCPVGR